MLNQKQTHKLTEQQFRQMLAGNNYSYAATAKAIKKKYGINFSRQAVRQRAKSYTGDLSEQLYQLSLRSTGDRYNY